MSHYVIIFLTWKRIWHCHREQLWAPTSASRGGPDVVLHTQFPLPGPYKLWAQFNSGGHIMVASIIIHVEKPLLPPKLMSLLLDD